MNKKLTIASALLAASSAFAFVTWNGADGVYKVDTEIGNDTETAGYWFSYDDSGDKGASSVTWPVERGNEYSADAMDPIIDYCQGVCGTAVLDKGQLTYNPFVGIGFNVVGETSATDKTPAAGDASSWGGICITYTSAAAPSLELGLGDAVDATIGYANPAASLAKATSAAVTKTIAWSGFAQPSWYKGANKMDGVTAASQLVAIKFKLQAAPGSYEFNIKSVGPYAGTCGSIGIKAARSASAAKAILSGRTLSVAGVNTAANVEVLNLQGQVVAKGNTASALSLANLDAGVYMVRVAGKSVNFSNKIVLK
ncbi:T9SS type A sorting domain-containing protein [uncultured Fibrobacter sp.]|uniref:T9SS type A sorting domain-containing protein n=1 Tax=uncultured Fibrobacter sp. TaxID=261512 RepID=UPI0025E9B4AF|nr:T9SS type A sorting domain-containing protein [uncultured Fibrobacter sp.]